MNLATKYRPKSFDDVVEQKLVVQIIQNLCESDMLNSRNFLLVGPAGTGKTTLARIIASSLNGNSKNIIEIDAASHNSAESAREIVQQIRTYPVGSKYKIFIVDECFHKNTLISTPYGKVRISDLSVGDRVYNLTGEASVAKVLTHSVKIDNIAYVRIGSRDIFTTKDHLFFTDTGWIPACELSCGDIIYDTENMRKMREDFLCSISERYKKILQSGMSFEAYECSSIREASPWLSKNVSDLWEGILYSKEHKFYNLFYKLWCEMEKAEQKYGSFIGGTFKTLAYIYLSDLWKTNGDKKQRPSESMLSLMCDEDCFGGEKEKEFIDWNLRMVWEFISNQIFVSSKDLFGELPKGFSWEQIESFRSFLCFNSDESIKSNVKSGKCSENDGYEAEKWNITYLGCCSWWKRSIYNSAGYSERASWGDVDIRISGKNMRGQKEQSDEVSYMLQARPRLSRPSYWNRGGWQIPQSEIPQVVGRKKSEISNEFRVDCVEVFKRGHNEELFRSCFTDSEINSGYVTMYDLEIDGHPSYFAEDVLVHNCHTLSPQSWQVYLKVLEESPAMSIVVLCTTNPEKIPATILSRVQTFQLSKISLDGIVNRLKYVIDCENKDGNTITYDEDAITFIGKLANGGMRDALTLLDKALAYSKNLTSENLINALGLPNYDDYFKLLNAYAKKDNKLIIELIDSVYNSGVNFIKWFEGFHGFVINVIKYIYIRNMSVTMIPAQYEDKISNYGVNHSIILLSLADKLVKLLYDLKSTQYLQEVALTYLCSIPKR